MEIKILDEKRNGDQLWFLGKISLWDYLTSVSVDKFEFEIQRGIVKNKYLDSILLSIKKDEAIPPITITANTITDIKDYKGIIIDDESFNILDGLQRTYRLWLYKKIAELATSSSKNLFEDYDLSNIIDKLKSANYYIPGVVSFSQIKSLLDKSESINVENIDSIYKRFDIYLYVWTGLDEKENIKKMLILNAGQRKVSINHQYELMFLQVFKDKKIPDNIKLFREKSPEYGQVKRGHRNIGEFLFSSTIIGIQSLIDRKPVRLSSDYIEIGADDDFVSAEQIDRFFNQPFLDVYLNSLHQIDSSLCNKNDEYKKWFVKDTTISGIMGAIGYKLHIKSDDFISNYKSQINKLLIEISRNNCFKLEEFYSEYNKLSSTKINIGDKVRNAIYKYTQGILSDADIKWSEVFNF